MSALQINLPSLAAGFFSPLRSSRNVETVEAVVREGNCLGCGTCEAVCPTGALRIKLNSRRGVYEPILDETACSGCGLCLGVCPGREVPIDELSTRFLDADRKHALFGRYSNILLGYACDEQVRYNSASGGLVTALLLYALEKGLIDGAVVIGHEPGRPLQTHPIIARTREEILKASGSMYCPTATNRLLREIRECSGVYAVVGLPCQVHALRKWQARDSVLRKRVQYVIGLFCGNETTYLGTEYFLWCRGIPLKAVRSIRYRSGGWPGRIEVRTDKRVYYFPRSPIEPNTRKRALIASAFHYDFAIPRCLVCPDHTCELADAAFADPHLPEMRARYHDGISWSIVRNTTAMKLIQSACADNCIHMETFPDEQAVRAQNYNYKASVAGRMVLWKTKGRPVPDFGRVYETTRRMISQARMCRWSFYSHNRWIWPFLWLLCVCVRTPLARIYKRAGCLRRSLLSIIQEGRRK